MINTLKSHNIFSTTAARHRWLQPLPLLYSATLLLAIAGLTAFAMRPRSYPQLIVGDGLYNYAYVRSIVFDHDLDMGNEYEYLRTHGFIGLANPTGPTSTGHHENIFEIGPALLWLPVYGAMSGIFSVLSSGQSLTGYELPLQFTVLLASVLYGWAALILNGQLLQRVMRIGPYLTFTIVISFWLATSAFYYQMIEGSYAHTCSWFAFSAFLLVLFHERRSDFRHPLLLGTLIGVVGLTYWALLPAAVVMTGASLLLTPALGRTFEARSVKIGLLILASVVAFLPQLLTWSLIYGTITPPTRGEGVDLTSPHALEILFSLNNGLFPWSPITLLGVAGLFLLSRTDPKRGVLLFLGLATYVWTAGTATDWSGGAAFGARRFIPMLPVFALGVAYVAKTGYNLRRILLIIMILFFTMVNLLSFLEHAVGCLTTGSSQSVRSFAMSRILFASELLRGRIRCPDAKN